MADGGSQPVPGHAHRRLLARHLMGRGIELGPGHHPFAYLPPATSVRYVDRWVPEVNSALFPELVDAHFPQPDVVADLDTDRLSAVPDASEDFVIASHVLEHLAEPLGMLLECHRVLRPGGTLLILLPDRRRTSDSRRPPTTLEHLVAEHERGVTEVDDEHLAEFLTLAWRKDLSDPDVRERLFAEQRQRSVHVHCWTEDEFFAVVAHTVQERGARWELVELVSTEDVGPRAKEFSYLLRRSTADVGTDVLLERLHANRELILAGRREREAAARRAQRPPEAVATAGDTERLGELSRQLAATTADLRRARHTVAQLRHRVERYERGLAPLRNTPLWPALRRLSPWVGLGRTSGRR